MIPRTLFTGEHELFRDQVRRFIATEITPHHAAWEKAGIVPRSLWHEAGRLGLLCTGVPEEYGGAGGNFLFGAIMIEEMARRRHWPDLLPAFRCRCALSRALWDGGAEAKLASQDGDGGGGGGAGHDRAIWRQRCGGDAHHRAARWG